MNLKNKVSIITGGNSGIGKAISLLFKKQGAKVIIADLKYNKIKNIDYVKTDISKEKDVKDLMEFVIKKYGKIDILVNNAGIGSNKDFEKITKKDWEKVLGINLIGTFLCTQKASKYMKSGTIVNISSIVGLDYKTSENRLDYSASKAGIINLTKSTSKKLAPKIRVNCIAPGYIETGLNIGISKARKQEIIKNTPLKRLGKAEEVAKVALFLASDDSSFITGEVIIIDGGVSIR